MGDTQGVDHCTVASRGLSEKCNLAALPERFHGLVLELLRSRRQERYRRDAYCRQQGVHCSSKDPAMGSRSLGAHARLNASLVLSPCEAEWQGRNQNHEQDGRETMTKLPSEKRDHLKADNFAFPRQRKAPLEDAQHVRNAVARFNQVKGASEDEKDEAWKRIVAAANKYGVKLNEKSRHELGKS